jgi:undecaprenyl-diphosphatase
VNLDHKLTSRVNYIANSNRGVRSLIVTANRLSPWLFPLLHLACWYRTNPSDRATRSALAASGFSGVSATLITKAIGHFIYRDRPFLSDPTIKALIEHRPDSSFPSDHAAAATAFFVALWNTTSSPCARVIKSLSVLTFVARLMSGLHWPSDAISGGLIGYFVARMSKLLDRPLLSLAEILLGS